MTGTSHFRSNLRDMNFNLFEFLRVQDKTLGHGPFSDKDEATARDVLKGFEKVSIEELSASFVETDRVPLQLDKEGNVTIPDAMKKTLDTYYEQQWHLMELPKHLGGYGTSPTVAWAGFELMVGANPTLTFYLLGNSVARVIDRWGTDAQKNRFVKNIVERYWGGTMALTEPEAGSDVGSGRTKAREVGDGIWELEGTKRFITNGDFDWAENIIHLVLARPEGAQGGTKGLSMFIVPKFWVNEDGSLGERNGVFCTGLEKKMGIKGSSTCEMTFGETIPARGLLVGEVHDGIRQMFALIEYARMAIGFKSLSTLSTAYLNALAYAKERVQGTDLLNIMNKDAPKVTIMHHPDVRRMFMLQKSHAEGLRALVYYAGSWQDNELLCRDAGNLEEAKAAHKINDLLLPLIKGYSSEKVYELLSVSLQCMGGSGYVQDHPHEQYIRDQKIDTLYEGTTHIQALDLFFRKIARDGGANLKRLMGFIRETVEKEEGGDALAAERRALDRALADVASILETMQTKVMESIYHVGLHGNRILFALSELVIGWLLVRHAALAQDKLGDAHADDQAFYEGKIASARFFCRNVLPQAQLARKIIESGDLDLMEISEEAF